MRHYLRLVVLREKQGVDPMSFHREQVYEATDGVDSLSLNLLQASALTGSMKGKEGLLAQQKHNITITIPKAMQRTLSRTLSKAKASALSDPDSPLSAHQRSLASPAAPSPLRDSTKRK